MGETDQVTAEVSVGAVDATAAPPLPGAPLPGAPLPGATLSVRTADGERLDAWHAPRPDGRRDVGLLLLHGFAGSLTWGPVQSVARGLAPAAGLLLLTARGHGLSSGVTTLGDREVLDVDAGVAALRDLGYASVLTCGWSMGGSAVLRHLGLVGERLHGHPVEHLPDAVVAISTTSRWWVADTWAMRRVLLLVSTRVGRGVSRRLGVRVDPAGWDKRSPPITPTEALRRAARRPVPVPVLIVHGDADAYFRVEHAHLLAAAAGSAGELWLLPGFGHAELSAERDPALLARLAAHLPLLLARAAAPAHAPPHPAGAR